ncbi:serine/threonine-protein phosphatase 2A 56 kDa regulatory subunit epsilon isoform-like [Scyliorhinus torazame]|uniref:serine/threonine-protein phosphatase 2A 56 kDa regulatory subunit epsilon isoform-like n=1 Tax=Scyliorhinus torazame TaxID=75743 RepID=UPI003B599CE9
MSSPTASTPVEKVDGFSRKSVRKTKQKRAQSSSQYKIQGKAVDLNPLPLLKDVSSTEKAALFQRKLQQCCVVFDFMDSLGDLKMKEYKRSTLNELVDFVAVGRGILTEPNYPEVVKMLFHLTVSLVARHQLSDRKAAEQYMPRKQEIVWWPLKRVRAGVWGRLETPESYRSYPLVPGDGTHAPLGPQAAL